MPVCGMRRRTSPTSCRWTGWDDCPTAYHPVPRRMDHEATQIVISWGARFTEPDELWLRGSPAGPGHRGHRRAYKGSQRLVAVRSERVSRGTGPTCSRRFPALPPQVEPANRCKSPSCDGPEPDGTDGLLRPESKFKKRHNGVRRRAWDSPRCPHNPKVRGSNPFPATKHQLEASRFPWGPLRFPGPPANGGT